MDLTLSTNPVMHRFYIDQLSSTVTKSADDSSVASTVLRRLDLGVGGTGVVGRTVSVMNEQQVVVGEGIIGWN